MTISCSEELVEGAVCSFTCSPHRPLSGPSSATCQRNESGDLNTEAVWSYESGNSAPFCEGNLSNGMQQCKNLDKKSGLVLSIYVFPGESLTRISSVAIFFAVRTCEASQLSPPQNGALACETFDYEIVCEMMCNEGYDLSAGNFDLIKLTSTPFAFPFLWTVTFEAFFSVFTSCVVFAGITQAMVQIS